MNSFRITDTKFRILKGGKIGLAMSIALIGGILSISSTSANAADEYSSTVDRNVNSDPSGFTVYNSSVDSVRVYATYQNSADYYDGFNWQNTVNTYPYNSPDITISAGTNITGEARDTGSDNTLMGIYSEYSLGAYDYDRVDLSNSTVSFSGNNDIRGLVGARWVSYGAGGFEADTISKINLNDVDVVFHQTVDAYTININAGSNTTNTDDFTFYGDVTTNGDGSFAANTGSVQFKSAATVKFNGNVTGNIHFNGNDGVVTLAANKTITGSIDTSGVNGTLIFKGAGTVTGDVSSSADYTLKEVRADGTGNVLFTDTHTAEVDHVNYQAAALIGFNGGLDLSVDTSDQGVNTVTFNNHDGVLQINTGSLTGILNQAVVTTSGNNLGTVTMVSGSQVITGNIGSSGHAIKTLNIGGFADGTALGAEDGTNYSTTTAHGDVYATNTVLNNNLTTNNSSLIMAMDYDLYSIVTTADNGAGVLTLEGGVQNVTGNVGAFGMRLDQVNSGANGAISNFGSSLTPTDVYADTVSNTGTGTTNFSHDVGANTINVSNGISNFTNDVTAATTNIGTGVANFNTNGIGTTTSNLVFTENKTNPTTSDKTANVAGLGSATANLMNGLTGNINFAGKDAVVNVWHEPITSADPFDYAANTPYTPATITGNITTTTNNTGIVNFRGAGIIDGTVGVSNIMGIAQLNINTNDEQSGNNGFEWKEVVATGDIYTGSINLKNDGTLTLEDGVDITGTNSVVALSGTQQVISTDVDGTGRLNFNGSSIVTGVVGSNNMAIGTIDAMWDTVTFNNMVYADTLWAYDNTIILNGQAGLKADGTAGTSANSTVAGMKGTINFDGDGAGTIQIGNGVNLTTGENGIQFVDANSATLTFNGSSVVNGNVGSLSGTDTFKVINGGAATETVTFNNNVYFMDSLNLSSTGAIEIADGKYAQRNSTSATTGAIVTTTTDGLGNLKYKGSTTLYGNIGTTDAMLNSVTFNSASNNVTQNIGNNVYADTVTIGGASGTTAISLVDVTGTYDYAGATTIKEYIGGTAANITSNVTLGGNLLIANSTSAINFGTSHVTVGMNHDGTTPGAFTTSNGAMSFTVNTQDITGADEAISTSAGSGLVTTAALNMSGSEKVHINYVGSLANNGTYTLISDTGTTGTGTYSHVDGDGKVTDNSFAIDTKIDKTAVGSDLILRADRTAGGNYSADQLYVQKSDTNGHFSNNAAVALAGISANGSQTDDMIEVIQKLELDSFGYGNSKENLAVQVQKLAPIVNTSFAQTSIGATKLVTDTVGSRLSDVRGLSSGDAIADKGVWAKVIGSTASQDKVGQFDGYSLSSGGIVFGIDKELQNNTIIGLAAGYTNTKTEQDDFRDGDSSTTDSYQLSLYASKTFDKAYIDGTLSYTKHNTVGTRSSAVGREASYDVDANQLSAKINGGYNFLFENKVTLTPFASLEYSNIKQDSYKEEGAGAISLSVDDVTVNRGAAGLGVKISKEIKTEDNVVYIPEFKLGANKYFGDDDVEVTAQFDQGNKFVTKGAEMSDMMYNAGLGVKTKFTEDTSVSLSTDYERSNDGDFQGVNGQLTFRMQF